VGVLIAVTASMLAAAGHRVRADPPPQNIVLILTDDQRWDAVQYMPQVESLLVAHGVSFVNAFDNNPLCCPARTTIMTGLTSGHNGVWGNDNGAHSGFAGFLANGDQDRQLFGWFHDAGYRTALVGKFLNGYLVPDVSWVLPGVDEWQVFMLDDPALAQSGCQASGYFATCYSSNGTLEAHGDGEYSTTTSGQKAVDFIRSVPQDQPLFLYYAPRAPHGPTLPEAKYKGACPGLPPVRPPSYDRVIAGGPAYMTRLRPLSARDRMSLDRQWIRACRTLLSVDDRVADIVQALSDEGRLHDTLILFASDNGFLFGEHRWQGKTVPYEESIRVPVIVRDDALIPAGMQGATVSDQITSLDYAPTFLQAAGLSRDLDGQSLFPLLGGAGAWVPQDSILIEHGGETIGPIGKPMSPPYCGVRTPGFMYARYKTGEEELYDLAADPYEQANVAADELYGAVLAQLRDETRTRCDPPPPGYTWPLQSRLPR
jgi:arylsulfatase A-like enzyme